MSVKRLTKFLVSLEIDPETVDRNPTGGELCFRVSTDCFQFEQKAQSSAKRLFHMLLEKLAVGQSARCLQ